MPSRPDPELLGLLYKALRSPLGVVVKTDNVTRLRQKLYAVRKTDDDLAVLSIDISRDHPETDLWITKNA